MTQYLRILLIISICINYNLSYGCSLPIPSSMNMETRDFNNLISTIKYKDLKTNSEHNFRNYTVYGYPSRPLRFEIEYSPFKINETYIEHFHKVTCSINREEIWKCKTEEKKSVSLINNTSYAELATPMPSHIAIGAAEFLIKAANRKLKPRESGEPITKKDLNRKMFFYYEDGFLRVSLSKGACHSHNLKLGLSNCKSNKCTFSLIKNESGFYL